MSLGSLSSTGGLIWTTFLHDCFKELFIAETNSGHVERWLYLKTNQVGG